MITIPPSLITTMKAVFPIVGVGASAGGLESFSKLLKQLDANTGMAFVLVQHLDPHHESHLGEILARATAMPVITVLDNTVVKPNHVYVMPPNVRMAIVENNLKITPKEKDDLFLIDHFLFSLASEHRSNAIGVVLSGTGSDGAKGIASISSLGGVTFAEDKKSAKFDGMPSAAIDAGVDFILVPEAIATELGEIAQELKGNPTPINETPGDFQTVLDLLRVARGMDFSLYKTPTIRRRILRRMAIRQISKIEDYTAFLKTHPVEVDNLYEDILIKVTEFFRNPESFDALKTQVFPLLFKRKAPGNTVRVWIPGCSTGEEAYSIAICLLESMEESGLTFVIEIFATDISETALTKARIGHYDASRTEKISPERLTKFFVKEGGGYRVSSAIRETCVFAKQNVTRDPPFSRLDLISCRNLLIYFTPTLQDRVLSAFHFGLSPGGFLLLGSAETIGSATNLFEVSNKVGKIFLKKLDGRNNRIRDFTKVPLGGGSLSDAAFSSPKADVSIKLDLKSEAERAIQEKFVPPGVIVNDAMEIVQFRGDTSPYLLNPPGELTADLFKMSRDGLLVELRTAMHEAAASIEPVKCVAWIRASSRESTPVSIDVIPFVSRVTAQRHFAVLFGPTVVSSLNSTESSDAGSAESRRFERELRETKDYLNAIIDKEQAASEELKSTSEEILSANEELQSSNEEIATAKEEVQATNEELITLNEELQSRNQELNSLYCDMTNVFASTTAAIVILSENLIIRRITDAAETVLNLFPIDIGKSLSEVAPKLLVNGLEALTVEVMKTLNTKDLDVQDHNGRWYSLRIKPYSATGNRMDGATIRLMDIDHLKRNVERLKEANEYAEAIIESAPTPILVLDGDLRVITATEAFCEHFRVKLSDTKNVKIYDLGEGQWNVPKLRVLLEDVLPKNERVVNFIVDEDFPGLGRRTMRLNARRLIQEDGKVARILLAIDDVTIEKQAEVRTQAAKSVAEASNQAKSDFLANISHEIRTPLGAILGYSELLANINRQNPEALQCTNLIQRNIEQLTELVDEILDIAKIEAGKLEVERVQFSILPEISDVLTLLQESAKGKGLALDVTFQGEIPESITSCPKRLRQILFNIVGNALKFTEHGGVGIVVKLARQNGAVGSLLQFLISDTGCGISPEQQERLFQPFSQADSSITRKYGGTGLGLALARRLAQVLGGDVVISESKVAQGSTFIFSLDPGPLDGVRMLKGLTLSSLEPKNAPPDWLGPDQRLAEIRILLAEDSLDIQMLMARFLESSGATVEMAANGAEAVKMAMAKPYDIVLMDMQMPILDGYEATKQLHANGYESPVVALTANAMRGERENCIAVGCVDYLSKPVKANVLIDTVNRLVKKKSDLTTADASNRSELADDPVVGPLIAKFVEALPSRMTTLRSAEMRSDWNEISSLAHQLSGACGGYGFPKMGTAAAKIEALAKRKRNPKVLAKSIARLGALCDAAVRGISQLQ